MINAESGGLLVSPGVDHPFRPARSLVSESSRRPQPVRPGGEFQTITDTYQRQHQKACSALGEQGHTAFADYQPRDSRHTLAVFMAMSGCTAREISVQLGTSETTVARVYARWLSRDSELMATEARVSAWHAQQRRARKGPGPVRTGANPALPARSAADTPPHTAPDAPFERKRRPRIVGGNLSPAGTRRCLSVHVSASSHDPLAPHVSSAGHRR